MATRPEAGTPWPQPTPHASSSKGKRKWDPADHPHRFRKLPRQAPDPGANSCGNVGNNVFTCYPTSDALVVQNTWTRVIWNTALPQFSQTNLVDVYLLHADSGGQIGFWANQTYGDGHLNVQVNDTWWGAQGPKFQLGKNSTQPFVFAVVRNGAASDSEPSQTTFTATQTAFPNSILNSQSSASVASAAAASSASASALSKSAEVSSASISSKSAASASASAALQRGSNSGGSEFPHWAIALLVVFGFLAIVCILFVLWLLIRNLRKRRHPSLVHRNSIGSQSPMMANAAPQSPLTAAPGSSIAHGDLHSNESGLGPLPAISNRHNIVSSDGASTVSRADSAGGPFSAVDAAAMAAAFRNVMRKPDFADRPMEEGESPEHKEEPDVLGRELAEEGRDIRSVSSSRGVKVETLSDSGDAAH